MVENEQPELAAECVQHSQVGEGVDTVARAVELTQRSEAAMVLARRNELAVASAQ